MKEKQTDMTSTDLYLAPQYIQQIADQITRMGARLPDWFNHMQTLGSTGEFEAPEFSLADFKRLMTEAIALTNDTAFGLLIGDRLLVNSHGLLSYVSSKSVTPREALELIARYFPLRTSLMLAEFAVSKTRARLSFVENFDLQEASNPTLEAIVLTTKNLFEYVSMNLCRAEKIAFSFRKPSHHALAEQLFGCPVIYQAGWNGFELSLSKIDNPVRSSNIAFEEAVQRCQEELGRLAKSQCLSSRVRMLMLEKHNGLASLPVTARLLNLTPRTLHRRLIEEGTSYRDILESVRQHLAMSYLRDSQLSIQEIAYTLGYADLSNFRRAFIRWTSKTPKAYRNDTYIYTDTN